MLEVKEASYKGDYCLDILFSNGVRKVIDLANSLKGEIFEPLKDVEKFKRFKINFNTVEWENGADFAPEYLFEL